MRLGDINFLEGFSVCMHFMLVFDVTLEICCSLASGAKKVHF